MIRRLWGWVAQILAATMFYTCLPISSEWTLDFRGIARVAPLVGVLVGGLVGLLDWGLAQVGMPVLTRSAIAVALWIAITGGLHLDGAMDTADGLAVSDPQRRLQAMSDSATGAFGAIAAIVIVLLKTVALSEIESDRIWILMAVAGWGRWGQLVAIARYLYLKPTGKGAFHKESIRSVWEALPTFLLLVGLSGVLSPVTAIALSVGGTAIALLTGAWLNHKLGGQTGDTYGAIVEWTEALLLCGLTVF
ncbi:adenosylcobinamide-GDP ribazoletransferase [Myxacorys almedinensis]|uniref:Adenosylcobinamide-GDP ribazoletransferase n=1 Tax=Myxacorys almedinensis A TaxID=2690445 RepID=A0A8J7Z0P8_9CYAN|nr:adenosylcobinamide-GDP ribazoletransferase [Myxacorys almedinensis]NDJ15983.1 adenosylcobinamide-GDP ribazoletransferase [Myxacorys almedinensis A]